MAPCRKLYRPGATSWVGANSGLPSAPGANQVTFIPDGPTKRTDVRWVGNGLLAGPVRAPVAATAPGGAFGAVGGPGLRPVWTNPPVPAGPRSTAGTTPGGLGLAPGSGGVPPGGIRLGANGTPGGDSIAPAGVTIPGQPPGGHPN